MLQQKDVRVSRHGLWRRTRQRPVVANQTFGNFVSWRATDKHLGLHQSGDDVAQRVAEKAQEILPIWSLEALRPLISSGMCRLHEKNIRSCQTGQ